MFRGYVYVSYQDLILQLLVLRSKSPPVYSALLATKVLRKFCCAERVARTGLCVTVVKPPGVAQSQVRCCAVFECRQT